MANIRLRRPRRRTVFIGIGAILALVAGLILSGCGATKDKFDQAFNGLHATMTTYNQYGQPVDEIKGASFRVSRDSEFDSTNSDGKSNNDSEVLLISLGDAHISHVGSTMIMAEDGLTDITQQVNDEQPNFRFSNDKPGTPWLNDLRYRFSRYWHGAARTIMVRSQDGTPIKVYGGNSVQVLSTDVPKSTWFRIKGPDGKTRTLFVYRADYTVADNSLLS